MDSTDLYVATLKLAARQLEGDPSLKLGSAQVNGLIGRAAAADYSCSMERIKVSAKSAAKEEPQLIGGALQYAELLKTARSSYDAAVKAKAWEPVNYQNSGSGKKAADLRAKSTNRVALREVAEHDALEARDYFNAINAEDKDWFHDFDPAKRKGQYAAKLAGIVLPVLKGEGFRYDLELLRSTRHEQQSILRDAIRKYRPDDPTVRADPAMVEVNARLGKLIEKARD